MKAAFKKRWLEALRRPLDEGGYIKGRGKLARVDYNGDHCFCVMGVACDLLVQDGEITWEQVERGNSPFALPQSVLTKMGMTLAQQDYLIAANDDYRAWDAKGFAQRPCDRDDNRWARQIEMIEAM